MLFYFYISVSLVLDLIAGDPRWFPHPVRFIGWLCIFFEGQTRKFSSIISLRWCGILAFVSVFMTTLVCTIVLFATLLFYSRSAAILFAVLLLYFSLATGDLVSHSKSVYRCLVSKEIDRARKAIANLVGRDTEQLDETAISRACIESVAENLVDGITAPLFWGCSASLFAPLMAIDPIIAAALGAVSYKSINTMDSMYGYQNELYLEFGWFAAKFDDVVNYLPARISGFCVIAAAFVMGYDSRLSAHLFYRDRLQSSSPNSGHTEAAFAGALGVQLGGESSYFGIISIKPLIGKELREPVASDIIRSNRLLLAASGIFFIFIVCCHVILQTVLK